MRPATPESNKAAAWAAVLSMALCVALLIASEFMPVSLLTPMAEGLGATEGQTGQAISISGMFAVAASLVITTLAGTLNRKWVLVGLTAVMLLSLVLVAAAPNFAVLMIGRALLGVCIGGFWALATAVIMRLVPAADVPRALAMMYGGQAIAAAFAAPMGSYLGGIFGWRDVFWALTPMVAINLVWHVVALPSLPASERQDFRMMFGLLKRPYFLAGLVASMLSWGSAFTMFTYLRPFLERVTGANVTMLSILLLVLGCSGFIGTWVSGRLLSGNVAPFLRLPALVMGGSTLGLLFLGGSPILAGLFLAVWGAMNTAMSVIWMTWMSQNAGDAPEAAGSLMVAAIQASILLGAVVGGWLLDGLSIQAAFIGSVVLAIAAITLVGNGQKLRKPTCEPWNCLVALRQSISMANYFPFPRQQPRGMSMDKLFWIGLAFIAGALLPLQGAFNARLGAAGSSPLHASVISFVIGTVALSAYVLVTRQTVSWTGFASAPGYAWLGGICGAFALTAIIVTFPGPF